MPGKAITVTAQFDPCSYGIDYELNGGTINSGNPTEYVYGVGAMLADATRENYLFEGWYTDAALTQRITEIGTEQTGDLILFAKWSLDPNHTHAYGSCRVGKNGLHERVCELCGKVEACTYTSAVTEPTCTEIGFTTHTCDNCGHAYTDTYVVPNDHDWDEGKVASAPTLTETGILVQTCGKCGKTREIVIPMLTSCDGGKGCPSKAYVDVPGEEHWAHVGIDFVLKTGLFYGTSEITFSPDAAMTRAMLVTVLYRLEGKPETTADNPFEDVADGTWYTDAVVWAAENGIVAGVAGGIFDPDGAITREQMATILYRYTQYKGLTLNDGDYVEEYPDIDEVSSYAAQAMRWANAEGLINGVRRSDGTVTLAPKDNATRAQVAAILMRYVQNVLNK